MFRNPAPVAESSSDVAPCDHPVPLSVLALDIGLPAEGWPGFLGRRGIRIVPDAIGRDSVASHDARRLLEERRADEIRKVRLRAAQEAEAVAADEARRATIWKGMPAEQIPDGVTAVQLWQQEEHKRRPRRTSPLEEALAGETLTFHPYGPDGDES